MKVEIGLQISEFIPLAYVSVPLGSRPRHPHTVISKLQNARKNERVKGGLGKWSSNLQDELQYINDDMSAAGFQKDVINQVLEQQYKMLDKLNLSYQKVNNE